MPRLIEVPDQGRTGLDACVDALSAHGFDPHDEASLHHAALQLRRLGNNRGFLGDLIAGELASRHRGEGSAGSYGAPVIMLSPPGRRDFFLRANIWPSRADGVLKASGDASFVYGLAHDHNFDFLTIGYFGPGYWSDYYEYDYAAVAGWAGEPVALRHQGLRRLEPDEIMLYRAHVDVHCQLPPDEMSVTINVMHAAGAQGWLDQYGFDCERQCIRAQLSHGASEAFVRIAVGLGGAPARDLAESFARHHPSDRMRLAAWASLASVAPDATERDSLWRRAESSGSRLVAVEASLRRARITA